MVRIILMKNLMFKPAFRRASSMTRECVSYCIANFGVSNESEEGGKMSGGQIPEENGIPLQHLRNGNGRINHGFVPELGLHERQQESPHATSYSIGQNDYYTHLNGRLEFKFSYESRCRVVKLKSEMKKNL